MINYMYRLPKLTLTFTQGQSNIVHSFRPCCGPVSFFTTVERKQPENCLRLTLGRHNDVILVQDLLHSVRLRNLNAGPLGM